MNEVRKFPAADPRMETGAIQFGTDWPGLFIRGDSAAGYALHLEDAIRRAKKDGMSLLYLASLDELLSELRGTRV